MVRAGEMALAQQGEEQHRQEADAHLQHGVFQSGDAVGFFVADDQQGVGRRRHQAAENAPLAALFRHNLPIDQQDSADDGQESQDFVPGQFFLEQQW